MNKAKRSKSEDDRLSELPDSLIFNIFKFLPITDVVKTELLSKRYENLWKTSPFLNFEGFKGRTNTREIKKFIGWAVMLWRGAKILKLKIDFGTRLNKSLNSDIDFLVRFAKDFGVEELEICLKYTRNIKPGPDDDEKLYLLSRCLYSCSSIKKLYLKGCNLHIPTKNVSWDQLKSLRLHVYVLRQDLIDKVLGGSPKLEFLVLTYLENHENLSIQSSSLTYLDINKYLYYDIDKPSEATELRISTPNLKDLVMVGVPYSKVVMNEVPLLTYAKLMFDGSTFYKHHLFSWKDFVGPTVKQIVPAIQNVKELILSDWCIEALGDVKNKTMFLPFSNVKELKLCGRLEQYEEAARLLELFPRLERLVLEHEKAGYKYQGKHKRKAAKFKADLSNSSFLEKLRSIKITWIKGGSCIFPFIKILLKHASKLEKMDFRSSNSLFLRSASEKVLIMPRSSQNAEFTFCEK